MLSGSLEDGLNMDCFDVAMDTRPKWHLTIVYNKKFFVYDCMGS